MTKILGDPDIGKLLERFYGFSDSLLRSVSVTFSEGGTRHIEIAIAVRDAQATENDGWVCVVLSVGGVSELSLRDHSARASIQVISDGIHIARYGKEFGLEFGGAVDAPETIADLRKSDAYILGEELSFDVRPY